ncbi:MAG: hypothetical protein ACP5VS_15485, partial [Desulfomonilaceae bacterium]
MKAAFSYFDNRIAPVFDTARQIVLVEAVSRRIVRESQEIFADTARSTITKIYAEYLSNIFPLKYSSRTIKSINKIIISWMIKPEP